MNDLHAALCIIGLALFFVKPEFCPNSDVLKMQIFINEFIQQYIA